MIGVADAFVTMTSRKRYREAKPVFMAREAFIRGAGEAFDPRLAELMVRIIDEDTDSAAKNGTEQLEKELSCGEYREKTTLGIPVVETWTRITFSCQPRKTGEDDFQAPSIILFDSYDQRVHREGRAISTYRYTEFGSCGLTPTA